MTRAIEGDAMGNAKPRRGPLPCKSELLLIVAAAALSAGAAEYYVDNKSGDDANDGRAADRALRTLAAVTKRLEAGDVLHLAPGRKYGETLKLTRGGSAASPIVVKGHGAVLTGISAFPKEGWEGEGDGLFVGDNTRVCAVDCRISGVGTGVTVVGGDLHLLNSEVRDCRESSVSAEKAGSFVTKDCRID